MESRARLCTKDGFPKVRIAGRWECVAEYLDRCIGGQRIVDMLKSEGTVYYVFESGHELPMLCFCCGTPLEYLDLERSRRDKVGRRLESMSVRPGKSEDGREMLQVCLELSGKGLLLQPVAVPVFIEAAAQMRHPPHCLHKPSSAAPGRRRKQERHKG